MSQPAERLIAAYRASGHPELVALADKWEIDLRIARQKRHFPVKISRARKIFSSKEKREPLRRTDLERIISEQVDRYIALGFHEEVYKNLPVQEAEAKYRADFTLPPEAAQPGEYVGRFDIPLVVEPRISLRKKYKLAKKLKDMNLDSITTEWETSKIDKSTGKIIDQTDHPTDRPYLIFTCDGKKYRGSSVEKALERFKDDEVGITQLELTDLFLQSPKYFVVGISAAGSHDVVKYHKRGHIYVPSLLMLVNRVEALSFLITNKQELGVGSCGREIIRLGTRDL